MVLKIQFNWFSFLKRCSLYKYLSESWMKKKLRKQNITSSNCIFSNISWYSCNLAVMAFGGKSSPENTQHVSSEILIFFTIVNLIYHEGLHLCWAHALRLKDIFWKPLWLPSLISLYSQHVRLFFSLCHCIESKISA